jgi:hypothetical protein
MTNDQQLQAYSIVCIPYNRLVMIQLFLQVLIASSTALERHSIRPA